VALETFNYLNSLVATNPVVSDGLVNGDDHIRGIKSTLLATFPSITGPITATQGAINAAAAAIAAGVSLLDHSHAYNSDTSGLNFVSSTVMDLVVGGQTPVRFTSTDRSAAFAGPVSAPGFTGPGCVPIGAMVMWLEDALPVGSGVWCWANGGTLSRTGNGAALFARWGTTYGSGDGSTTFNVINMQEVVPVGRSQMGGATAPGFISNWSAGLTAVLGGGVFGAATATLGQANLPAVNFSVSGGTLTTTLTCQGLGNPLAVGFGATGASFGGTGGATYGIAAFGTITASTTMSGFTAASGGSGTAFNNVQPSRAVNYIIRIG
jgi:microcystin-dependent protein